MCDTKNPLLFLTITSIEGRHLTDTQGRNFIDFSTQCYLGFDFNKEIEEAQIQGIKKYGNVVPWSRTVACFDVYHQAEKALAELVGTQDSNFFPSTTLLNHGVIPVLAGFEGALIAFEKNSYSSSYEGALLAKAKGAVIETWNDEKVLESLLRQPYVRKLIVTDGVNSMSGNFANLPKLQELCMKYDAYLYVDDAHGFGVVGEHPSQEYPLGKKGNGLVRYYGLSNERIYYVGCLSKAYGLPGAFLACAKDEKKLILSQATPYDISFAGQASVMYGILEAIKINAAQGDVIRQELISNTLAFRRKLSALGFPLYGKNSSFPIVSLAFSDSKNFLKACKFLYQNGILPTVKPNYKTSEGIKHLLRFIITKGLSQEDIEALSLKAGQIDF